MMRLVMTLVACLAVVRAAPEAGAMIGCEECVEGMEFVEAYMRDPLWVAEYTLYLEQNFCVHDQGDRNCVDMVKTHFPPMHEVGMEAFEPQRICDADFAVCGATHPPNPPHPTRPPMV